MSKFGRMSSFRTAYMGKFGQIFKKGDLKKTLLKECLATLLKASPKEKFYVASFAQRVLDKSKLRLAAKAALVDDDDDEIAKHLLDMRNVLPAGRPLSHLDSFLASILKERLEDRRLETKRIYSGDLTPELAEYVRHLLGVDCRWQIVSKFTRPKVGKSFNPGWKKVFESASPIENGPYRYAVFYTISLCNFGARGLGMSHILLSSTLRYLTKEYPEVEHFQTLSPIIKFKEWLERNNPNCPFEMYSQECQRYLEGCYMRTVDMIDPVAGFHYGNGAILDRVLPNGNSRATNSYGMMASYKYELKELERRASVYRQNKRDTAR